MKLLAPLSLTLMFSSIGLCQNSCPDFDGTWKLLTLNGNPASDLSPMHIEQSGCDLKGDFTSSDGSYKHMFSGQSTTHSASIRIKRVDPANCTTYMHGGLSFEADRTLDYEITQTAGRCGLSAGYTEMRTWADEATYVTFDPAGSVETQVVSINSKGVIAGSYFDNQHVQHGFIRAADGTITAFNPFGVSLAAVTCLNDAGTIGGWVSSNAGPHAFLRLPDGTVKAVTGPGRDSEIFVYSINNAGVVAGGYTDLDLAPHGFFRTANGAFNALDAPASYPIKGLSINQSGTIAGFYSDATGQNRPFVRDLAGAITTFEPAVSVSTSVAAINNSGDVAGSFYNSGLPYRGYVRKADGSLTRFDAPDAGEGPSQGTVVTAISEGGTVVGYVVNAGGEVRGFARDPSGAIRTFAMPGSLGTYPASISERGVIAGTYLDANTIAHGFVLTL